MLVWVTARFGPHLWSLDGRSEHRVDLSQGANPALSLHTSAVLPSDSVWIRRIFALVDACVGVSIEERSFLVGNRRPTSRSFNSSLPLARGYQALPQRHASADYDQKHEQPREPPFEVLFNLLPRRHSSRPDLVSCCSGPNGLPTGLLYRLAPIVRSNR